MKPKVHHQLLALTLMLAGCASAQQSPIPTSGSTTASTPLALEEQEVELILELPPEAVQVMIGIPTREEDLVAGSLKLELVEQGEASVISTEALAMSKEAPTSSTQKGKAAEARLMIWARLPEAQDAGRQAGRRELKLKLRLKPGSQSPAGSPWIAYRNGSGGGTNIEGPAWRDPPSNNAATPRQEGLIRWPLDGTTIAGRSTANITLASGYQEEVELQINGRPVGPERIGRRIDDPAAGLTTREYIAVPLQAGTNIISASSREDREQIAIEVAGVASAIKVVETIAQADGITPIKVRFIVVDERGLRTPLPSVTVEDAGPFTLAAADGDPAQAGYQLRVTDGSGLIEFTPTSIPMRGIVKLTVNGHAHEIELEAKVEQHRAAVAVASGTVQMGKEGIAANGELRATIEAPVGRGQLTVVGDSSGAHDPQLVEQRMPILGDGGKSSRPLQADGPLAMRYDHPDFSVLYARDAASDALFARPDDGDALQFRSNGSWRTEAYLAPWAGGSREAQVMLDGTRIARLPEGMDPQRARLYLETVRLGNTERRELQRGRDYAIDALGIITLPRPIEMRPDLETEVRIIARGPLAERSISPSAQVATIRTWSSGEAKLSMAAGMRWQEDGPTTFGIRYQGSDQIGPARWQLDASAQIANGSSRAKVEASGTVEIASPSGQGNQAASWTLSGEHEEDGYAGVASTGAAGQRLAASLRYPLSPKLNISASARASNGADGAGARGGAELVMQPTPELTLGAGTFAGAGTLSGFGLSASAKLDRSPWLAAISASQDFGNSNTNMQASLLRRFPLSFLQAPGSELAFGVKVDAKREGGAWKVASGLALQGRSGPYIAEVNYALPSSSGNAGELRGSVGATFPLKPGTELELATSASPGMIQASANLRKRNDQLIATIGTDVAVQEGQLRGAAKFSATYQAQPLPIPLTYSADGLFSWGARDPGYRISLGLARRQSEWSTAGYLRARGGAFSASGSDELIGELAITRSMARSQQRIAVAAQASPGDPKGLSLQGIAYANRWLTDSLGVAAAYRAIWQPNQGRSASAFGLEANWRPLPEFTLSLGYNFMGYAPLTAEPTQKGFYLRLDTVIDSGHDPR